MGEFSQTNILQIRSSVGVIISHFSPSAQRPSPVANAAGAKSPAGACLSSHDLVAQQLFAAPQAAETPELDKSLLRETGRLAQRYIKETPLMAAAE